jgi:hypothetical protein
MRAVSNLYGLSLRGSISPCAGSLIDIAVGSVLLHSGSVPGLAFGALSARMHKSDGGLDALKAQVTLPV